MKNLSLSRNISKLVNTRDWTTVQIEFRCLIVYDRCHTKFLMQRIEIGWHWQRNSILCVSECVVLKSTPKMNKIDQIKHPKGEVDDGVVAVTATVVSEAAAKEESTAAAVKNTAPKRNCHAQHITRLYASSASTLCSLDSTLLSHVRISICVCIHFVLASFHSFVCSFFYNLKYILFSIFICSFFRSFNLKCFVISFAVPSKNVYCTVEKTRKKNTKHINIQWETEWSWMRERERNGNEKDCVDI